MKLSRSDNHIIITMMKLSRCVLDSIFHQTNKKLVDSIFLAVLGVVCLQNEGAIITRPDRAQHCHSQVLVNQRKYSISFREKSFNLPLYEVRTKAKCRASHLTQSVKETMVNIGHDKSHGSLNCASNCACILFTYVH